ncbi:FixP1 Di-heme cytochrome c [Fulvimarina pelagi HTCC2506]|uniref:FixP1 Di-heme cytochrome c n=1 Tax=Fulvimarina pelagi HTCC2506 TaxID=314231 RepID=Q0FY18_9HYPH|nr:cytochrome c [Fulvimarina pelagi]EAU39924.1 FixP1 Di-heme cytochrome c [Fulvimarina pelagi HTCC2506]
MRSLRLAGVAALAVGACAPALAQSDGEEQPKAQSEADGDLGNATIGQNSNASGPAPSADEKQAKAENAGAPDAEALMSVDVNTIYPGSVTAQTELDLPPMGQAAAQSGMNYFNTMNCIGCHAPNGAGGMGPALSNNVFVYGGQPAELFLTIKQGRPNGMPAYGTMLPDAAIWQLVAYVKSISQDPNAENWGTTVSLDAMTIEQVPAEYQDTVDPWSNTKDFSFGKDPYADAEPPTKEAKAQTDGEAEEEGAAEEGEGQEAASGESAPEESEQPEQGKGNQ